MAGSSTISELEAMLEERECLLHVGGEGDGGVCHLGPQLLTPVPSFQPFASPLHQEKVQRSEIGLEHYPLEDTNAFPEPFLRTFFGGHKALARSSEGTCRS